MKKHVFCQHQSEYIVQFFDVDSMDIMWHGNYVKYLEMARCAFLDEIHYSYDVMKKQGYMWPIVKLDVKYIKPLLFRQKIKIQLKVLEFKSCFRVEYLIFDSETNQKLTIASTTQVAVSIKTQELQFQTPSCWQKAIRSHSSFKSQN